MERAAAALDLNTTLALDRTHLASERTLMGWIRTALSMISFGFTIGKLGQAVTEIEVKGLLLRERMVSVEQIARFLVSLGLVALLAATVQHLLRLRSYRKLGDRRGFSISVMVAVLLFLVGSFALTALVLKL